MVPFLSKMPGLIAIQIQTHGGKRALGRAEKALMGHMRLR